MSEIKVTLNPTPVDATHKSLTQDELELEKLKLEYKTRALNLVENLVNMGISATSDGELLGASLKPKFNSLYAKVKAVRANRQRQGFKDNSLRLDKLKAKLTGMVKTMAGEVSNKLIEAHPGAIFVVEDLDLRGCRGAKRFAYRALHHSLETKAPCEVVNPAYSSQTCPSCGYVSRSNRSMPIRLTAKPTHRVIPVAVDNLIRS